jgi:Fur family peroxide stress response transcriptional regulator
MQKYKDLGLKLTPQRLSILAFLEGNKDHPTAEEIYRHISRKFSTMSFATVYKTLETLKQQGRLTEITIDPEKRHFDPNTERHHHIICSKCKRIADIFVTFDLTLPEKDVQGFEITGSHVEFYGLCPKCREETMKEVKDVTVFKCSTCGTSKEAKVKPRKCPKCSEKGAMQKC